MVLIPKYAVLCNVNVTYNSKIKDISTQITYMVYDLSTLAQEVTLLISIWEVSGANVSYTTDYPSGIFHSFHHHLQTNTGTLP
jgi:hypothetical protein